jgi:hypothetical protein
MSPAPAESSRLRILGDALAKLRDCAGAGADEVLGLYPDVGDRETQQAVESCLEDLADVLRRLDEGATSLVDDLYVIGVPHRPGGSTHDPSPADQRARR